MAIRLKLKYNPSFVQIIFHCWQPLLWLLYSDAFIIVENICCQGSSLGCDFYFRSKVHLSLFLWLCFFITYLTLPYGLTLPGSIFQNFKPAGNVYHSTKAGALPFCLCWMPAYLNYYSTAQRKKTGKMWHFLYCNGRKYEACGAVFTETYTKNWAECWFE